MTRVCFISDTHMRHEQLELPSSDLLVHCGDATRRGKKPEFDKFLAWFARTPAPHKLYVAGNHDFICEQDPTWTRARCAAHDVHYLDNEGTTLAGLSIWGSPITPIFRDWAFNRERGAEIAAYWSLIPSHLDLLITHGPPRRLGDKIIIGAHVGCDDLLAAVLQRPPRVHVFGHIHEAFGEFSHPSVPTRFFNVSSCPFLLGSIRPPVLLDL